MIKIKFIITDYHNILLILCGAFYSVLCVFSLVTGLIYASGKKELNPLELSDKFVKKLDTKEKIEKFTIKMGWVTFVVGIVQGLTAFSFFKGYSPVYYFIAGFTLFSIASEAFKLKGKINAFPIIKLVFYLLILIVLLLPNSINLFFLFKKLDIIVIKVVVYMKKKYFLLIFLILLCSVCSLLFVNLNKQTIDEESSNFVNIKSGTKFETFDPWSKGTTLTAGYYKLEGDVWYDKQFKADLESGEELYIDLNGYSFTYSGWANWEHDQTDEDGNYVLDSEGNHITVPNNFEGTINAAFYGTKGNIYIYDSSEDKKGVFKVEGAALVEGFDNITIENLEYTSQTYRQMIINSGTINISKSTVTDTIMGGAKDIETGTLNISNSEANISSVVVTKDVKFDTSTINLKVSGGEAVIDAQKTSNLTILNSTVNSVGSVFFHSNSAGTVLINSATNIDVSSIVNIEDSTVNITKTTDEPSFYGKELTFKNSNITANSLYVTSKLTVNGGKLDLLPTGDKMAILGTKDSTTETDFDFENVEITAHSCQFIGSTNNYAKFKMVDSSLTIPDLDTTSSNFLKNIGQIKADEVYVSGSTFNNFISFAGGYNTGIYDVVDSTFNTITTSNPIFMGKNGTEGHLNLTNVKINMANDEFIGGTFKDISIDSCEIKTGDSDASNYSVFNKITNSFKINNSTIEYTGYLASTDSGTAITATITDSTIKVNYNSKINHYFVFMSDKSDLTIKDTDIEYVGFTGTREGSEGSLIANNITLDDVTIKDASYIKAYNSLKITSSDIDVVTYTEHALTSTAFDIEDSNVNLTTNNVNTIVVFNYSSSILKNTTLSTNGNVVLSANNTLFAGKENFSSAGDYVLFNSSLNAISDDFKSDNKIEIFENVSTAQTISDEDYEECLEDSGKDFCYKDGVYYDSNYKFNANKVAFKTVNHLTKAEVRNLVQPLELRYFKNYLLKYKDDSDTTAVDLYWTPAISITFSAHEGDYIEKYYANEPIGDVNAGKDYFEGHYKYEFVEWNSKEDGSGETLKVGKSIEENDLHYYAIYKKSNIYYACYVCNSSRKWLNEDEATSCKEDTSIESIDKCVDTDSSNKDNVSNPKTGVVNLISIMIVATMLMVVLYLNRKKITIFRNFK